MNLLGRTQDILVGVPEVLWFRPTLDGDVVTIAVSPAPTVAVEDPDGTAVTVAESPAINSTNLTLTRTWVAATTPSNYLAPYKITWAYTVGTTRHYAVQYFFLLANLFISQVVEGDITDLDPQVKTQAGQASGSLSPWIEESWGDLWDMVWQMTHLHPSRYPSDRFRNAHIEQAKYRIYEWTIARQAADSWIAAAKRHEARAKAYVNFIVSNPRIVVLGADENVGNDRQRQPGFY